MGKVGVKYSRAEALRRDGQIYGCPPIIGYTLFLEEDKIARSMLIGFFSGSLIIRFKGFAFIRYDV